MTVSAPDHGRDWSGDTRTYLLVWGLPTAAIVAGLFIPEAARTVVWTLALLWMGVSCLLNARRCGRVHCRFTGPFYLLMIVPVLLLGSVAVAEYAWWILAAVILLGGKVIWSITESTWGRYSG